MLYAELLDYGIIPTSNHGFHSIFHTFLYALCTLSLPIFTTQSVVRIHVDMCHLHMYIGIYTY